jgi:hypothetical protein
MRKWFIFNKFGLVGHVYATDLLAAANNAETLYGKGDYRLTADI